MKIKDTQKQKELLFELILIQKSICEIKDPYLSNIDEYYKQVSRMLTCWEDVRNNISL